MRYNLFYDQISHFCEVGTQILSDRKKKIEALIPDS
jgi:hypothetical protein